MIPTNVVMHQQSKVLELSYENGSSYCLPFEFLRVLSPSAEVRGHGPGQETRHFLVNEMNHLLFDRRLSYRCRRRSRLFFGKAAE